MGWSRVTLPMWRPRDEIRASDTLVDTTIDATADAGSIPAVSTFTEGHHMVAFRFNG